MIYYLHRSSIDLGTIVLALLAHDRYLAANDPIVYNAEIVSNIKRVWRRIGIACLVVIGANSISFMEEMFDAYGWMSKTELAALVFTGNFIRTTYLFGCLYV